MLRTNLAIHGLPFLLRTALLCTPLLGAGCVLTSGGNDDTGNDTGGTSDPSATSFTASDPTADPTTDPDSTGSDSVGETTGVPTGECTESLVLDGGFEAGSPSKAWTEMSQNFSTPICDAECTDDPGAGAFAGQWYAWFGGTDEGPEIASVAQTVTIPPETAFLSFRFEINASAGAGDDFFEVTVDGTTVFLAVDTDINAYASYTPVSVDISDFADGGAHTITFTGDFLGIELTNFFLDEVALVSCVDEGATTTGTGGTSETGSSSSSDSTTTAADESSSSGSSDSSSSSGESSGSSSTGV